MKQFFLRLFGIVLVLILICGTIPAIAAETGERLEAHQAYYDYLTEEIAGIGGAVRDEDYSHMFYENILHPAITEELLAVYLVDVTNDGLEELIIKRHVTHKTVDRYGLISITPTHTEWVCIYSYVNGQIKRIGQNRPWYKPNGDNSWTTYEPDGYIGAILSASYLEYTTNPDEYVTLCWDQNGNVVLCDKEFVTNGKEGYFSFYGFNGSYMERITRLEVRWVPDWSIGSIESDSGSHLYLINDEYTTATEYMNQLRSYTERGTLKLLNNDYHDALRVLSATSRGEDVPFGSANPHCHIPSEEWFTEDGVRYRTCQSGCDVKLNLHTCEGGTPTCFCQALCDTCQQPYGELTEHTPSGRYFSENGQHFFKCTADGCTQTFDVTDCTDANLDHECDVCAAQIGVHEAAEGSHICEYCSKRAASCTDGNLDHVCDVCGEEAFRHEALYGEHTCRHCDQPVSICEDNDHDGQCDICGEAYAAADQGGCGGTIAPISIMEIALLCMGILTVTKRKTAA